MYPDWAVRELLLNAIIHRDYQIGNAPIKFYDYNNIRLELSNPGGLYGQVNADNFPFVNDYRNPLLAEAMKIMGYVNKYNRGIAKVKTEMDKNGNPAPIFDVNKLTEFRVTLLPSGKLVSGFQLDELKAGNDELKAGNDELKAGNDELKKRNMEKIKLIEQIISENPGLQRKQLAAMMKISVSTLDRCLKTMISAGNAKIEHSGDRKHGGWFPKS